MAVIKCKMCGGDMELSPDKTIGTCEYCGCTMTMPKVDDQQRAAAFDRGNHFRRLGEFDKALSVYERIIQEDENDAEAHWCCALCRFGIEYVKDPASGNYMPTCHRASFDSFLEDVDYKAALAHADPIARRQYEADGEQIAAVQRGILSTVQKEKPFDVFICYKETDERGQRTVDSTLAQDIYYQLTDQGRRVFFARITLEDKVGQEYEPYIFAALHSAKVMVVVGTRPEYLNAVWVKNEWSRYLALMRSDRKRLLIPCYRDMDPYDMPEQLSVLQAYDMGKIGFIQDLIRGISKVLDIEKPKETVKETITVQSESGANVTALLKRGKMALEDGEWERADEYFDRVLDMDAECAEAYFGKGLADGKYGSERAFLRAREPGCFRLEKTNFLACEEDTARIEEAVKKYSLGIFLKEQTVRSLFLGYERGYVSYVPSLQKITEIYTIRGENKFFERAVRYAKGDFADSLRAMQAQITNQLNKKLAEYKAEDAENVKRLTDGYAEFMQKAEEEAARLNQEAAAEREKDYINACNSMEQAKTEEEYRKLLSRWDMLQDYKDSEERFEQCVKEANRIRDREQAYLREKEEAQRQKEIKARKARRKRNKIIAVGVLVLTVVFGALTKIVFIPLIHYKMAEKLSESGDDIAAAIAFGKMGSSSNAKERALLLWDQVAARETISTSNSHTVGLKSDGTVVAVGNNDCGQCNVQNWTDIVAVSACYEYTIGLKSDGTVVAVGNNDCGQCNVQNWTDIVAIAGNSSLTVGLKSDGTVIAVGRNSSQCGVQDWTDIMAIFAGTGRIVGLKLDGTVVVVDNSDYNNDYSKRVVQTWRDIAEVAVYSCDFAVGLKLDGTVVTSGANYSGECNVQNWKNIVAVSAGFDHTVGLLSNGRVMATGDNYDGQCNVLYWKDIVAVSAGFAHTIGLKSDGTVVAVGENDDGQCNVEEWTDIKIPNKYIKAKYK